MANPCLSVLSVGEFKNHPHGKFVIFEQFVFKKNPCSPCPSVCKKYSLDSSDSCSKKYHPHGKSVLFEQSNNALHEELTSDPTGANFATTENSKNHPFKSRIKNIPHSSDDKRRAILRWRIIM